MVPTGTNNSIAYNKAAGFSFLLLLICFISCFYHTFGWLHYKYSYVDSYYSHGYLVPFVTAYLIYLNKEKISTIQLSSNSSGLLIIVSALIIHILAVICDINFISGFCMFLYILGCCLYLFGINLTKQIAFPLFFLLFMFPVPNAFLNYIGLPTKSMATHIGLLFIDAFNIPYLLEGFRIDLTHTTLVVGTPCNGVKSLISFLMLGMLAIYFIRLHIWKKVIIFLCLYPLTILVNGCRIALLIFIADKYGIEKASPESYLHDLSGLIVFVIGFVILLLVISIFKKITIFH